MDCLPFISTWLPRAICMETLYMHKTQMLDGHLLLQCSFLSFFFLRKRRPNHSWSEFPLADMNQAGMQRSLRKNWPVLHYVSSEHQHLPCYPMSDDFDSRWWLSHSTKSLLDEGLIHVWVQLNMWEITHTSHSISTKIDNKTVLQLWNLKQIQELILKS